MLLGGYTSHDMPLYAHGGQQRSASVKPPHVTAAGVD